MGIHLPDDIKKNLLNTGHAERIVDLQPEPGKVVPSYLSIDTQTNRLISFPVENMKVKQSATDPISQSHKTSKEDKAPSQQQKSEEKQKEEQRTIPKKGKSKGMSM